MGAYYFLYIIFCLPVCLIEDSLLLCMTQSMNRILHVYLAYNTSFEKHDILWMSFFIYQKRNMSGGNGQIMNTFMLDRTFLFKNNATLNFKSPHIK